MHPEGTGTVDRKFGARPSAATASWPNTGSGDRLIWFMDGAAWASLGNIPVELQTRDFIALSRT